MKEKTKETLKKFDNEMKKKKTFSVYGLVVFALIMGLIMGTIMYFTGYAIANSDNELEQKNEQDLQMQKDLMQQPLGVVYETFLKYLMVKAMFWLPLITFALLLGWVVHGVF